mmetsp:Transcript_5742/g.21837  ORF Transcript_5742/g.21837 Transcript_5742/m.21837 type:complete len:237 (-) Transcript_5742:558-1268(-)
MLPATIGVRPKPEDLPELVMPALLSTSCAAAVALSALIQDKTTSQPRASGSRGPTCLELFFGLPTAGIFAALVFASGNAERKCGPCSSALSSPCPSSTSALRRGGGRPANKPAAEDSVSTFEMLRSSCGGSICASDASPPPLHGACNQACSITSSRLKRSLKSCLSKPTISSLASLEILCHAAPVKCVSETSSFSGGCWPASIANNVTPNAKTSTFATSSWHSMAYPVECRVSGAL